MIAAHLQFYNPRQIQEKYCAISREASILVKKIDPRGSSITHTTMDTESQTIITAAAPSPILPREIINIIILDPAADRLKARLISREYRDGIPLLSCFDEKSRKGITWKVNNLRFTKYYLSPSLTIHAREERKKDGQRYIRIESPYGILTIRVVARGDGTMSIVPDSYKQHPLPDLQYRARNAIRKHRKISQEEFISVMIQLNYKPICDTNPR